MIRKIGNVIFSLLHRFLVFFGLSVIFEYLFRGEVNIPEEIFSALFISLGSYLLLALYYKGNKTAAGNNMNASAAEESPSEK